jgi:hypothetical protein
MSIGFFKVTLYGTSSFLQISFNKKVNAVHQLGSHVPLHPSSFIGWRQQHSGKRGLEDSDLLLNGTGSMDQTTVISIIFTPSCSQDIIFVFSSDEMSFFPTITFL